MGYFDKQIFPITIESEVKQGLELNFENKDSIEQREIADQDLISAKALIEISENSDDCVKQKACDRKAIQTAMEATEKYFNSVIYADEKHKKINSNIHKKLVRSHNLKFKQRETENAGINILDSTDLDVFDKGITKNKNKKTNKEQSSYNAIRYQKQNIIHDNAKNCVKVAEKAQKHLEEMREEQKNEKTQIGNYTLDFDEKFYN